MVSTTVETVGPNSAPMSDVKMSVPMVADAMFTMLSAMSSVVKILL